MNEKDQHTSLYQMYRGRCKELSEAACAADPTLTLTRGHYFCPLWNRDEPHWWTTRPDGSVYDPSRMQFPSAGLGTYTEFSGLVECAECGKDVAEADASYESNYAFCSGRCYGRFVGVI